MIVTTEPYNHEFIHPLQYEVRHDDRTFDLIGLASDLVTASEEPYSEEQFNPYHELMKVMYNYVGDPDPEKRKGIHVLPDVTRDTIYGHHEYSLGCATVFNPETAELCIIRKDPDVPSNKAKDWMVISYNICTGELVEKIVQDVIIYPQEDGDHIILDIVSDDNYSGTDQLKLSVKEDYSWDGTDVTISGDTSYGRDLNRGRNATFGEDIVVLIDEIRYTQQLQAKENELESDHTTSKSFYKSIGHTAVS